VSALAFAPVNFAAPPSTTRRKTPPHPPGGARLSFQPTTEPTAENRSLVKLTSGTGKPSEVQVGETIPGHDMEMLKFEGKTRKAELLRTSASSERTSAITKNEEDPRVRVITPSRESSFGPEDLMSLFGGE